MNTGAYAASLLIRLIQAAGGQKTIYKDGADLRALQCLERACRRGRLVRVSEDARAVMYRVPPDEAALPPAVHEGWGGL